MRKVLFLTPLALAATTGPDRHQPGMWETTVRITQLEFIGGPPEIQARANAQIGQTQTSSECLTEERARDPVANLRETISRGGPIGNCQLGDQLYSGGVIRVRDRCPVEGGGSVELAIDGSFTETTIQARFKLNLQNTATQGATGIRVSSAVNARRTGECPSVPTAG